VFSSILAIAKQDGGICLYDYQTNAIISEHSGHASAIKVEKFKILSKI